jgi:glycosyltransferase involved in cell wall biosynthesis
MPRRPKVLMIAPTVPDRTGNGLAMRMGIFLGALARVAEVDLVVPSVAGSFDAPASLPASLGVLMAAFPVQQLYDTRYQMLRRLADPAERLAAFRGYGRPSYAAAVSGEVLAYMKALGAERSYDLVHAGRIYMAEAALAAATAGTRLSLDLDEDDYASLRSIGEIRDRRGHAFEAEWFRIDADASDHMVAELAGRFDRTWIASDEDRASLTVRHAEVAPVVLRNAVEFPPAPRRRDDGRTLMFVGSFGYDPNVEGILWFAQEIWPRLRARFKGPLRTVVVGPDPPRPVKNLECRRGLMRLFGPNPDFVVRGRVADLRRAYEETTLAIAPLRAGRGTRLKLLEAAAEAVPVIATGDAAHGLPRDPPWAWIGDDAAGFAQACADALGNPEERARRVAQGRALIAAEYDRAKVVEQLAERFRELLPS